VSDFNSLVEREIPRLRRYARALTRSGDRADDLVQEVLIRAISKAHLWQTGTDIRAWLFTIMHNQYVNMVRHAMREEATIDIEQMSSRSLRRRTPRHPANCANSSAPLPAFLTNSAKSSCLSVSKGCPMRRLRRF